MSEVQLTELTQYLKTKREEKIDQILAWVQANIIDVIHSHQLPGMTHELVNRSGNVLYLIIRDQCTAMETIKPFSHHQKTLYSLWHLSYYKPKDIEQDLQSLIRIKSEWLDLYSQYPQLIELDQIIETYCK